MRQVPVLLNSYDSYLRPPQSLSIDNPTLLGTGACDENS